VSTKLTLADTTAREQALRELAIMANAARARLARRAPLQAPATIKANGAPTAPSLLRRVALDPNWLSTTISPRRFAWYPYLPTQCVSLLIGEGAVGKSTVLLAILAHVAAGIAYLGRPTVQGRVVYVAAEDDAQEIVRRLQTIVKPLNLNAAQQSAITRNFEFYAVADMDLNLLRSDRGVVRQTSIVESLAADIGEALVVAIDPVSRLHGCEENSNTVATKLVQAGEVIAHRTGAAVLLAHHTGKAAAREEIDDAYAARGGSGFADAARSVLRLIAASPASRSVKGLDLDMQQLRDGNILRLRHAKSNYERRAPDVWLERSPSGQLAQIIPVASNGRNNQELLADLHRWWASTWNMKPFSKSRVRDASTSILGQGVSRAQRDRMWEWAVSQGYLIPTTGANRGQQYVFAATSPDNQEQAPNTATLSESNRREQSSTSDEALTRALGLRAKGAAIDRATRTLLKQHGH
jgi:regulatory protein RepA